MVFFVLHTRCLIKVLREADSKTSWQMTSTSGMVKVEKYELEKFNGKNDFSYWRMQMKNLLISQKLHKALAGKIKKHKDMFNED